MGTSTKHLRKDQATTILCQQEVDWEESDSDEGEKTVSNIASLSSEPINITDSRPQNADRSAMMHLQDKATHIELPHLAAS